jgi:hypothetical protein
VVRMQRAYFVLWTVFGELFSDLKGIGMGEIVPQEEAPRWKSSRL